MNPVKIQGAEYAIGKVFSNDFVFKIPLYQRPYAWATEQADALLDDLITYLGDGNEPIEEVNPYFLGSIVLIKGDQPDAEVVDGQQRLTTLTILLAALRTLVPPNYATNLTTYLYQEEDLIAGIPNRYRLWLRERDQDFFKKYIQDQGGIDKLKNLNIVELLDSQQHITENGLRFLSRLQQLPKSQRVRLAQFIVSRCFLVVVSTPDLDSAYRIFSVLNDRGLNLSITDILKADVIGKIPEQEQEEYTAKWEDIEEKLGRDMFKELFSHIRTIHRRVRIRESVLKEFRRYVHPAYNPQRFINEILYLYADAFDEIKKLTYENGQRAEQVNQLFWWLNQIDNSDWLPPAILFLSNYRDNPNQLVPFFTDLERLAAGLMIQRANINERIERHSRLLTAIECGEVLYTSNSPLQLTTQEQGDILTVLNGDLYPIQKICRFVLLRLDTVLSEGKASYNLPITTVEHVLPQHPAYSSHWVRDFTVEEHKRYVHCLGNLALLSRKKNIEAHNRSFDRENGKDGKKQIYSRPEADISFFALTTQVQQNQQWTPTVIQKRQTELIGVLKIVWRL